MKNRIKLTAPSIKSRAQADDTLRQIAELTLRRNAISIELDQKITAIKDILGRDITDTQKVLEEKTELIRAWAEANPTEFNGLKSLDTTHAVIGWRTGQPTLKTLAGWTWDRVLEKIKSLRDLAILYVRTKEEVNKQAIITDRELIAPEQLRDLGLKILQEESFFIEPKLEQLENRLQSQAA
jgi:phage host-nuclease inhibitor protein Gam